MNLKHLFDTRRFLKKAGQIPGETRYHETTDEQTVISCNSYHLEEFREKVVENIKELDVVPDFNNWIKIIGFKDNKAVKEMGEMFNIHPLILEDALNTDHLPKVEFSQHHLFFTLKFPVFKNNELLELKHVSLIVGSNYLITLQNGNEDNLYTISARIKDAAGRLREKGIMYLFYSIIDYIIDQYFFVMENLRDQIENTEDKIIEQHNRNHIEQIQDIKKQIVLFRKYTNACNKAIYKLINEENKFVDRPIRLFFNDINDHVIHLNEQLNTFKELQTTLLEINMANISNSMNRVMKTLTVIASIFIPLTFIAGVYGMNFTHMPELQWKFGYPAALMLMLLIALIMMYYMKRKQWF